MNAGVQSVERQAGQPRRRRDTIRIAGGLAAGALCLWLSLRGTSAAGVIGHVRTASIPLVALAIGLVVVVAAAKAARWQWLFPATTPVPSFRRSFGILMTSQMLNMLVPVRLGEVARLGLMRQAGKNGWIGIPVGATLGTIVVEKTLDLLTIGVLAVLAAPLAVLPGNWRSQIIAGGLVLALGLLGALFLAGHYRDRLLALAERLPAPHNPLLARVQRGAVRSAAAVLESLAVLEGPRLAGVIAITAGIWLFSAAMLAVLLVAFGLPPDPAMALVLMLALTSSNWAPTPPALIGVVGAVTTLVLARFGVGHALGLAVGSVLNVVLVAPPVLLGGFAVWARLLSLQSGGWRHAFGLPHGISHGNPALGATAGREASRSEMPPRDSAP